MFRSSIFAPRVRTRTRVAAALAALSVLAAGCSGSSTANSDALTSEDAASAAQSYLTAWVAGDLPTAGRRTTAAAPAQEALEEVRRELKLASVAAEAQPVEPLSPDAAGQERAAVPFAARLELEGLGTWPYEGRLPVVRTGDGWLVEWTPAAVHPQLTDSTMLTRERSDTSATTVVDAQGRRLMYPRPVVEVAARRDKLTDPAAAYRVLDELGRDAAKARAQLERAAPTATLPQITVRKEQFDPYASAARAAGLLTTETTRTLAETATFAKPVLEAALAAGDPDSGAGGGQVRLAPRAPATAPGEAGDTSDAVVLHRFPAPDPPPLRTTLDLQVQTAAEKALAGVNKKAAALVAIDARTGEVRAAASRDVSGGLSSFNRAFVGRYAPGSTFKVVTASALLGSGLEVDDPVACPREITVRGKKFGNVDGFALGTVPFRTDFARSCNTAIIAEALKLPEGALREEAGRFGLGQTWAAGVPTFSGSIEDPADEVAKAANSLGQGTVLQSPLGMATVAATAASGTYRSPRLLLSAPPAVATPLPEGRSTALRTLMVEVVQRGSGQRLRGLPGTIGAKTGTAEFSASSGPGTHAWMIGYRDDLAWAVLVENGGGGGAVAGPVAEAFLEAAPR